MTRSTFGVSFVAATASATYGSDLTCSVNLTNPDGWAVGLTFASFSVDASDNVTLYGGGTDGVVVPLGRYSGTQLANSTVVSYSSAYHSLKLQACFELAWPCMARGCCVAIGQHRVLGCWLW